MTPNDLVAFDGFLFGIPTRYGRAVGAASAFFDATGGLWGEGKLVGELIQSSIASHAKKTKDRPRSRQVRRYLHLVCVPARRVRSFYTSVVLSLLLTRDPLCRQETTALTTIPFLAHHGISFVPIGFANPHRTYLPRSS